MSKRRPVLPYLDALVRSQDAMTQGVTLDELRAAEAVIRAAKRVMRDEFRYETGKCETKELDALDRALARLARVTGREKSG